MSPNLRLYTNITCTSLGPSIGSAYAPFSKWAVWSTSLQSPQVCQNFLRWILATKNKCALDCLYMIYGIMEDHKILKKPRKRGPSSPAVLTTANGNRNGAERLSWIHKMFELFDIIESIHALQRKRSSFVNIHSIHQIEPWLHCRKIYLRFFI